MTEPVSIPISFFEYVGEFERPIFAMWLNRAETVQGVFDALKSWGIGVENVEGLNEGKVTEQGVVFRLPSQKSKFTVNPAQISFSKEQPDWTNATDIINMISAATTATLRTSGAVLKAQKVAVILHIQPKRKPFREILEPFWPQQLIGMQDSPLLAVANVLKWESGALNLDGSAILKNGIFMRLELKFSKDVGLEQISQTLKQHEDRVFALLGIEEER